MQRLALVSFAILLSACGGGGSDETPVPPALETKIAATVIAGPDNYSHAYLNNPVRGCQDGAFDQVIFGHGMNLALESSGRTLYSVENGGCDNLQRIRKIDLENRTVDTLAVGAHIPSHEESGPFNLASFLSVSAIADAGSGDLLIADSEVFSGGLTLTVRDKVGLGNGIWLLKASGELVQLAGFQVPNRLLPMTDGVGAEVVFESITKICPGSQGAFYVLDMGFVRKLTLDGKVKTLEHEGRAMSGLACGADGRALTFLATTDGLAYALPFELKSQRIFPQLSGFPSYGHFQTLASDTTAWIRSYSHTASVDFLVLYDLVDGKMLEEYKINLGYEHYQLTDTPITITQPASFATAGDGLQYLATDFSIIEIRHE